MAKHGTSSGTPWEGPEVGEGYRLATTNDTGRKDIERWISSHKVWTPSPGSAVVGKVGTYYRVPLDRIPTEEDAKQRAWVVVWNADEEKSVFRVLYGVFEHLPAKFLVAPPYSGMVDYYQHARLLRQGEREPSTDPSRHKA
jgi:hypothetical protein